MQISEFEDYDKWVANCGRHVELNCKHSGCKVWKAMHVLNQVHFEKLKKLNNTAIWYCHLHRKVAFHTLSILSYNLMEEMIRIANDGEVGTSRLHINKSELEFLKANGLLTVGDRQHGARLEHPVTLTEEGRLLLKKMGFAAHPKVGESLLSQSSHQRPNN